MYKVFIDHKPIIFVSKKELSTNYNDVSVINSRSFFTDIEEAISQVSLEQPLYVVCEDELDLEVLFSEYQYIEAAGGIVRNEGKYLLIEREGMWDLPKGLIEKNENQKSAAIREVEEECGIKSPTIEAYLIETYHTYFFKSKPVLKKTYWYVMNYEGQDELRPQLEEGITKVAWKSQNEFLAIRGNTFGSINEVLDAYKIFKQKS